MSIWLYAEMSFISSPLYARKLRTWERKSLTKSIVRMQVLPEAELSIYAAKLIIQMEGRITLKTISEVYGIPYQTVRRYAAKHNWTDKRKEFWNNVWIRVRENLRQQMIN